MYLREPERIFLPVHAPGNVVDAPCQEDESIEILGYGFTTHAERGHLLTAYVDVVRVTR